MGESIDFIKVIIHHQQIVVARSNVDFTSVHFVGCWDCLGGGVDEKGRDSGFIVYYYFNPGH